MLSLYWHVLTDIKKICKIDTTFEWHWLRNGANFVYYTTVVVVLNQYSGTTVHFSDWLQHNDVSCAEVVVLYRANSHTKKAFLFISRTELVKKAGC